MFLKRSKKGQVSMEVAILYVAVAAALIATIGYVKGGFSRKLKASADQISGDGGQYNPEGYSAEYGIERHSKTKETSREGTNRTDILRDETTRTGSETSNPWADSGSQIH